MGGVLISLALLGPLAGVVGADIAKTYSTLFLTSFGSTFGFGVLLTYAVPLVIVGLAVGVPYRAGLFNIGGEGQLLIGAFLAAVVGASLPGLGDVPGGFLVLLLVGAAAGAVFGAIAGALRAWRGVNEIVTTIMLNFVALFFVQYWIAGPFRDPKLTFAASPSVVDGLRIIKVGGTASIPLSALVAVVAVVLAAWWAFRTRSGWKYRLLGMAPSFAKEKGVRVKAGYLAILTVGGALAGLAGATELVGNQYRIGFGFSPGWGIDAVAIALLARGNPLMIPLVAFSLPSCAMVAVPSSHPSESLVPSLLCSPRSPFCLSLPCLAGEPIGDSLAEATRKWTCCFPACWYWERLCFSPH